MRKKTRKILFYCSVLIFLILSALVVLFALGYKYDFIQNKFLKTGSLEIKANVGAEVYINDGLAGDTSFLGNSFSKGRLLPRSYTVRAQSENYQSWQKVAKIEAGFLTYFPKIVLLPQDFEEETVASSSASSISIMQFDPEQKLAFIGNKQKLESINLKNGEKKVIKQLPQVEPKKTGGLGDYLISPDGTVGVRFGDHEIWVKWFKDSDYQPFKKTGDTELITRFSQTIEDVQWYKDSAHIIVSVGQAGQGGILKFIEIDDRGGLNIMDIAAVSGPFYYDRDLNAIFKFDGKNLVRVDLSR